MNLKTLICAGSVAMLAVCGQAKTLVVYYSWSGNTRFAAETIAAAAGADVAEIVPVDAYSKVASECSARVVPEVKERATPAIRPLGKDVADYDRIFVGTPIWMGTLASPVRTFLTRGNFEGKKLRLFVTHGHNGPDCVGQDFAELVGARGGEVSGVGIFRGKTIREQVEELQAFARAADGRLEIVLTDIARLASPTAWRPMEYETQDGIRGKMLYAPYGLAPRQRVEIKLPVRGRYDIFIGSLGTRYALETAPLKMLLRLKRDPAPVAMEFVVNDRRAGWWAQACENEWKEADLDGDTLVVENLQGCRGALAWVRLVPVEDGPRTQPPAQRMVMTDDACAPAADLDELFAPIMRFAGTPVKAVYFCVGNGAFSFAVPSAVAISSADGDGQLIDNEFSRRCAADFARLHRKYPDLLSRFADFVHSIGLEFHVSFRTGCTVDCLRFSSPENAADPGESARGICRPECMCKDWEGRPVARFSYASDEVQDFFLRFYREMLTEKVDGINLIWIRALPAMLFEPAFREKFRAAYGEEVTRPDDPRVLELRKRIVTGFHRRVRALAGKKRVSIFVPAKGEICESFGLDVHTLVKEGLVDEVDVGDSLQTATHEESFGAIDFAYFRKACEGTSAEVLAFLWDASAARIRKSQEEGAGVVFWDGGQKSWDSIQTIRDIVRPAPAGGYPTRACPLKTLRGFDMQTYPWHVAY